MNRKFRALLILGRVSNLPTVWSNCLAGWWLSGGGNIWKLPLLFLGTTFLYLGGMFLNDAFDANFDRARRSSRPIPSGVITEESAWAFGWSWLALGILCLLFLGKIAGALAVCIVIYNAAHKAVVASPWLMGLCRFWIYAIAGSVSANGLNGNSLWCGLALAFYIAGLSYVARRESFRGPVPYWPLILLAVPVFLAMLMNAGKNREDAVWVSLALVLWIARCARSVFQRNEINVGKIVSGLLAGIVFVDWLAVAPAISHSLSAGIFLPLLGATLLLQRFVPAT